MKRSKYYNLRLPERGAQEGEANDAADIEDLTYDLDIVDGELERQRLEDARLETDKATRVELAQHKAAAVLDHLDGSVTDAKLGERTVLTTSGPLQSLLTAIGSAIKAVTGTDTWNDAPATTLLAAKAHAEDAQRHLTADERTQWNAAVGDRHAHANKSVLDGITAAMVSAWNTVSGKLPLSGGTLTGFLTLHAAPTDNLHAATKKYVDDTVVATGSGDMAKSVYDPQHREAPLLPEAGDASQTTATFTEAAQDADIVSGETLSTLFGKIKKRFSVLASAVMLKSVFSLVGNPNLLDNTDFKKPINQRGQIIYEFTEGRNGYCIDRWVVLDGKFDASSKTFTAWQTPNRYGHQLRQPVPYEKVAIGDTVTVSAQISGAAYKFTTTLAYTTLDTAQAPLLLTTPWGGFKLPCYQDGSALFVIWVNDGQTITIDWMKLEKGSIATPYVPKGYGVELSECLRYYQKIFVDWRTYPPLNNLIYRIPMTALHCMRTNPTITKPAEPYTFGCDITGLEAKSTSFTVQVTVNQTGVGAGAAALSGTFDLSADL